LHLGDFAVAQSFQHDEQERRALILHQGRECPLDVACARFRSARAGRIFFLDRGERRPARKRASRLRLRFVKIV
jgi:hypothetical protein